MVFPTLIPHLAGKMSLSAFRLLVSELSPRRVRSFCCPFICRAGVGLLLRAAGFSVPRPGRLHLALAHLVDRWPAPATSHTLAAALASRWASEALDLLWALSQIGIVRPRPASPGKALLFDLVEGRFIGRDPQKTHQNHSCFVP